MKRADMIDEAIAKALGINERKYVREGLGARHAVGHFDPLFEPRFLKEAKLFDVGERVHAAKHTGDDHEKHGTKVMAFVPSGARVFNDLEGMKGFGQALAIIDFIRIARHSEIVRMY